MTPDDLDRELLDLDRFSPPPLDPASLLQLQTRASSLAQENSDLRLSLTHREARISELLGVIEQHCRELGALQSAHLKQEQQRELELADWRRQQQYWSFLALSERADWLSKRTQWIHSVSLAVAALALCFSFWLVGEKYWTFTHNDQLRMLQTAAQDKADARILYQDATKKFNDIVRLRNQIRRAQSSATAPQYGMENLGADSNARSNQKEKDPSQ